MNSLYNFHIAKFPYSFICSLIKYLWSSGHKLSSVLDFETVLKKKVLGLKTYVSHNIHLSVFYIFYIAVERTLLTLEKKVSCLNLKNNKIPTKYETKCSPL